MDYGAVALAALTQIGGVLVGSAVGTLIGAPIMKLSERGIPLWRHALICFWAFARGIALSAVANDACLLLLKQPYPSWAAIVVLCGVGWLISADLKREGVNRKFPGVGARVILGVVVATLVVVVVAFFAKM